MGVRRSILSRCRVQRLPLTGGGHEEVTWWVRRAEQDRSWSEKWGESGEAKRSPPGWRRCIGRCGVRCGGRGGDVVATWGLVGRTVAWRGGGVCLRLLVEDDSEGHDLPNASAGDVCRAAGVPSRAFGLCWSGGGIGIRFSGWVVPGLRIPRMGCAVRVWMGVMCREGGSGGTPLGAPVSRSCPQRGCFRSRIGVRGKGAPLRRCQGRPWRMGSAERRWGRSEGE